MKFSQYGKYLRLYSINASNRLPIIIIRFEKNRKFKNGIALIDTGAAVSVVSAEFVKKWNFEIRNGPKVKLSGFNNSVSYSDSYVMLKIFDDASKFFTETKFLILAHLSIQMDMIIGFDCIREFKLITEEDFIILEKNGIWVFARNKPKSKIVIRNGVIPPGPSILEIQVQNSTGNNKIEITNENIIPNGSNEFISSPVHSVINIPIENISNSFFDTKNEKICDIEEVNSKILKLNKPIPPHHRKNKKLPPLNMKNINVNKDVEKKYIVELKKLLREYHYCFSRGGSDIGCYSGPLTYDIKLLNEIKETFRSREFKGDEKKFIREELKNLENNNIICEFPVSRTFCGLTLARKKTPEGPKLRLCLNSQIVNVNTAISQNYQLPDLQRQIEILSNRKFYCRWDLRQAYWHVRLPPKQMYLYAFEFENKTYTWLRSSFGTKGMSSMFSCLMESIFGAIPRTIIYMDDLSIYANNLDEMMVTIRLILQKCSEFGLTFNLEKCSFFTREIKAFGYVINENGNIPDPIKIEQLLKLEMPTTLKKLQSALGSFNYYNKSIKDYKEKASCFYELTSNFKFKPELKKKWDDLLKAISKRILRNRPNYNLVLYISTDSSDIAGGATFYQKIDKDIKLLMVDSIKHYGRWLLAKPSHKEFAIVYSMLKKHRKFITLFPKIHLVVDNSVVYALLSNIDCVKVLTKSVPVRWLSYISLFNFTVSHVKGDDITFVLTDLLSRQKCSESSNGFWTIGQLKDQEILVWKSDEKNEYALYSVPFTEFLKPMNDEYLRNQIKLQQHLTGFDDSRKDVRIKKEKVEINGKLKQVEIRYLRDKLLVPPEYINDLLSLTHDHQNPTRWYQNLKKLNIEMKYLHKRVFDFWKSCVICQRQHPKKDIYRRHSVSVTDAVGETAMVDVLHVNNFKFLNLVDHFSGFVWSELIPNETEKALSENLMKIIFSTGLMFDTVITDNHISFKGEMLKNFCSSLNIRLIHTSSRNPRGNSKIESIQGQIVRQVKLMQHPDVPIWLTIQQSIFILNNTEDKIHKLSPFEILYLKQSKFPTNIPSLSMSKLQKFQPATTEFYKTAIEVLGKIKLKQLQNLNEVKKPKMYEVGDLVLLKNYRITGKSDKILPAYSDRIFKIIHKNIHTSTYEIEKVENDERLNRQRFKVHHRIIKKLNKKLDDAPSKESISNSTEFDKGKSSTDKSEANEIKKKSLDNDNKNSPKTNESSSSSYTSLSPKSEKKSNITSDTRRSTHGYRLRSTSKPL